MKIDEFDSLRLSGCLTGYEEIGRCRYAFNASKSRGLGEGGDGGRRVETPAEFWPYVSSRYSGIFYED